MPNHTHFMVTPPTKEMCSNFIKHFAQRYAQRRNWKLAVCAAYIELNPCMLGCGRRCRREVVYTARLGERRQHTLVQ